MITEGVLKALAATQEGVPCIGLMGMWNWSLKRTDKNAPRLLIPDLADIDWRGKQVLIVCDSDPTRKPGVNHGSAELGRILTDRGADCVISRPPLGPRGEDGRHLKQGLDDFIVLSGGGALREWGEEQHLQPPRRDVAEYRAEMVRKRAADPLKFSTSATEGLGYPSKRASRLDCGPTGCGKSRADIAAIRKLEELSLKPTDSLQELLDSPASPNSLILAPTHAHCEEVVEAGAQQGLTIVPYPKLSSDTCEQYEEASAIVNRGLAFQLALCPKCPFREDCQYREQRQRAERAQHAVATQARGVHTLSQRASRNLLTT
jgi:hypothetical protein